MTTLTIEHETISGRTQIGVDLDGIGQTWITQAGTRPETQDRDVVLQRALSPTDPNERADRAVPPANHSGHFELMVEIRAMEAERVYDDNRYDWILDGAARWVWGTSWANAAEETGREWELGIEPGVNIMDVMPEPPQAAWNDARRILDGIIEANAEDPRFVADVPVDPSPGTAAAVLGDQAKETGWRYSTLAAIVVHAVERDLKEQPPYARNDAEKPWTDNFEEGAYLTRLGECLAAQSIGDGVSWTDDHADIDIVVPSHEPVETMETAEEAVETPDTDPAP